MVDINRRKFVAGLTTGMVGLSLGKHSLATQASEKKTNSKADEQTEPKIKKYNVLGKTGIKTSDIIFGVGNVFSPSVIRYAFDLGVNFFETAENYMQGRSEEFVGNGLKGVRDKAFILTKHFFAPGPPIKKDDIIKKMEVSLKKLKTDYVDIAFLHQIEVEDFLKNEEILAAYSQMKKDGKIRFSGFSTHAEENMLKVGVKPEHAEFVQVILFRYNHMEGKKIEPLIQKVRERGIGTMAMKTLAGGKQGNLKSFVNKQVSYPQAAVSWVLTNKHVDCATVSMSSFSHVETFVAASGQKLKRDDLALLHDYRKEVDDSYCRVSCTTCEASCPHNVAISDVMRYAMYYEDYGHQKNALEHYASLDNKRKPVNCASCRGYCSQACPYGLPVKDKLMSTHDLLTVA